MMAADPMDEQLRTARERFRSWLADLDDGQLAALLENWGNVMDDAALDRIDSWVIAGNAIADLRSRPPAQATRTPPHTCGESGSTSKGLCLACLGRVLEEKGL